jgi:VanZ family protein
MTIEPRARRLLWAWAPLVAYMAIIFVGSSIGRLPDPGVSDKAAHLCEYAVLGVLMVRVLAGPGWRSPTCSVTLVAVLLSAAYGVSDETHQLFVPGRQFDVGDMAADACGAGLTAGALWAWGIIRRFSAR